MRNRIIFLLIGCLLIGSAFIYAGCGGGSSDSSNNNYNPNPTYSPVTGPYIYTYTSTDNENHNHTARVYGTSLSAPDASGWTDTSSQVLSHTHTMALTQAQLSSINSGQYVTVTSSTAANPTTGYSHSHTWTVYKAFNQASSAADNHSHDLVVSTSDLTNPPAQGVTYNTTTALSHYHTVSISQQQLSSLNNGASVTVNTSTATNPVTGVSHYHTYTDLLKPW
ncbi:MAG: hypothetical protein RDV48_29435 [Candidatus Eremiobacteraeota bacterium]|nr:hypothetical protein [Candidatus Eremiobacteraeota bacterium]